MPEICYKTECINFSTFGVFVKEIRYFLQNAFFVKTLFITFLAVSQAIFELQRFTIPHFNPCNKLLWPQERQICSSVVSFRAILQNICKLFFYSVSMWVRIQLWPTLVFYSPSWAYNTANSLKSMADFNLCWLTQLFHILALWLKTMEC